MKSKKFNFSKSRMKNWEYPSTTILVTLTEKDIRDRPGGLKQIVKEWKYTDGETLSWWYRTDVPPSKAVTVVYWVIDGVVRYRSKLDQVHLNKKVHFPDKPRPTFGAVWFSLSNFESLPPDQHKEVKRFSGWKYINPETFFKNETGN